MPSTITDRLYGENSSVAIKAPVVTVSTTNIALSGLGAFTTPNGSYTPNEDDRILVVGQNDQTQNGIYNASQTAWQRAGDFDGFYDVVQGTMVLVVYPNGQSAFYQLTTPDPIIGTTVLAFSPYAPPNQNFPQTTLEAARGIAVVNGGYVPGDARRYGCDPTGVNDSAAAFANWSAILDSYEGVLVGTFKSSASIAIPSNAVVDCASGSTILYTGNAAAMTLTSVKNVTLRRLAIDLAGAGTNAIGIQIQGAWFVDIEHPQIDGGAVANNQQAIQINTSAAGSPDFGAYCIRIIQPSICCAVGRPGDQVAYGVLTQQTAGDTVQVTHLQILGGWINSGTTAAVKITAASTWKVDQTTLEGCADGLQYESCNNGAISLGEVDCTGYAVNPLDALSSHITVLAPSQAGNPVSGYINTANSIPDYVDLAGELRMYPNGLSSSGYGVSYKAQFSAVATLVETVYAAGGTFVLRNVNSNLAGGIQQFTKVAAISGTGTAGTNLSGTANFVASTSVNVVFPNAEPDANYRVVLTPVGDPGGSLWVSVGQTAAGFQIICSASTSVAVNWLIVR